MSSHAHLARASILVKTDRFWPDHDSRDATQSGHLGRGPQDNSLGRIIGQ